MSEQYSKHIEDSRKLLNAVKKDILFLVEQRGRGERTFELEAQIQGEFTQINGLLVRADRLLAGFIRNPKEFNLSEKELGKRQQVYDTCYGEKQKLELQYKESLVAWKAEPNIEQDKMANFEKTFKDKMTTGQLADLKAKQEAQQEEALDQLLGTVRQMKSGQKAITTELNEQEVMLDKLDEGVDLNNKNMSKVRRNMIKLLDSSNNCCLGILNAISLVGLILNFVLWQ